MVNWRNLEKRSAIALAVVATSVFLLLCFASYGRPEYEQIARGDSVSWSARIAWAFIETCGVGAYVLALLPLVWGLVVYFQDRVPDLVLRGAGTAVFACSTATLAGLLNGGETGLWTGHVGAAVATALTSLSGPLGLLGTLVGWTLGLALLFLSFLFATDWFFHTLRRGTRPTPASAIEIPTEPATAELLDDPTEAGPRTFVAGPTRAAEAAAEVSIEAPRPAITEKTMPTGWTARAESGRTVLTAPQGYRGVEFLPSSDDLLLPATRNEAPAPEPTEHEMVLPAFFDDEVVTPHAPEPAEATAAPAEEAPMAVEQQAAPVPEPEPVVASTPAAEPEPVPAAIADAAHEEPAEEPRSGIAIPDDSPFYDDVFFAADAGAPWPVAQPSDGASAVTELATTYATPEPTPAPEPEAPVEEPPLVAFEAGSRLRPEEFVEAEPLVFDEVIVSRLPVVDIDDVVPFVPEELTARQEPRPAPVVVQSMSSAALVAPEMDVAETASAVAVAEPAVEIETASGVADSAVEVETAVRSVPVEVEAVAPAPAALEVAAQAPAPIGVATPASADAAPQLALFDEPPPPAPGAEPDLGRLHFLELDPLFPDALGAILERSRASAVVLQRSLGIGYARGIRILDQMSGAGLLGPDTPSGAREIRVTREAWDAFRSRG